MSPVSYLWNSEIHLNSFVFWIELIGSFIEVVVAASYVFTFGREATSAVKKQREHQIELFAFVAAIILLVVVVCSHRIGQLQDIRQAPRSIFPEKMKVFADLTQYIDKKTPICMYLSQRGDDTEDFGLQLRKMFTDAGFTFAPNADPSAVETDAIVKFARNKANDGNQPWVLLLSYSTNAVISVDINPVFGEDGASKPRPTPGNQEEVYAGIVSCLVQIGIPTGWDGTTNMPVNTWVFFVPPKSKQ